MMPVAPIVIASTLALILVSLVTKPPSAQTLERYFPAP
jgi:solute:Na+ symporter, SSS family